MSFTYDVLTDAGKLRLLISDINSDNYVFEDDEISAFLAVSNDNVLWAAALALETQASNEALTLKRIVILELEADGPAVATELRRIAGNWREVAMASEMFETADVVYDKATATERYLKQILRENA